MIQILSFIQVLMVINLANGSLVKVLQSLYT